MAERIEASPPRQSIESVPGGLLGLVGVLLLLVFTRGAGAFGAAESAAAPPVCSAWHRGQGESHSIDLGQLARSYKDLKDQLARSIGASMKRGLEGVALQGYDAGLPACRRSWKRSFRPEDLPGGPPPGSIPTEFLGKTLWFTRIEGTNSLPLPDLVRDDPDLLVFATRVETLESLNPGSKVFGRPVNLAPRGLPEALGVRCGPALVVISKNAEVKIHENP